MAMNYVWLSSNLPLLPPILKSSWSPLSLLYLERSCKSHCERRWSLRKMSWNLWASLRFVAWTAMETAHVVTTLQGWVEISEARRSLGLWRLLTLTILAHWTFRSLCSFYWSTEAWNICFSQRPLWWFPEMGVPPNHAFHGIFHNKPTIVGVPPFMDTPICLVQGKTEGFCEAEAVGWQLKRHVATAHGFVWK